MATRNDNGNASNLSAAFPLRGDVATSDADGTARKTVRIATVSHTLDAGIAERLRHFAFRERISESAVIEFALRELFGQGDDSTLGTRLRESGAALRRKV